MKFIKVAVVVIIVVLVLNLFGMLNPETSKKVDNAVNITKVKINDFKYKDKAMTDMSLNELSSNISSDINYLKEEVITKDGIKLSNKGLAVIINPTNDKVLVADVDPSESKAIESIEKLLYNLTKKDIKVPDEFLEKGKFTVVVEKINGEYDIKFDQN